MAIEWFYQVAGETRGPVSARELHALAETGTVTPDTRVKRGGDRKWVSARRVVGLFEPGGAGSAEPPPAPSKGPPPLPAPVCASGGPLPDEVADGSKAGRLRRMRPRHWMLVAGAVTLCLIFPTALIAGLKRGLEAAGPMALLVLAFSLLGVLWNVFVFLFCGKPTKNRHDGGLSLKDALGTDSDDKAKHISSRLLDFCTRNKR